MCQVEICIRQAKLLYMNVKRWWNGDTKVSDNIEHECVRSRDVYVKQNSLNDRYNHIGLKNSPPAAMRRALPLPLPFAAPLLRRMPPMPMLRPACAVQRLSQCRCHSHCQPRRAHCLLPLRPPLRSPHRRHLPARQRPARRRRGPPRLCAAGAGTRFAWAACRRWIKSNNW